MRFWLFLTSTNDINFFPGLLSSLPSHSAHIALYNWWMGKAYTLWFFFLWLFREDVTRHSQSPAASVESNPQLCSLDTHSLCCSSGQAREQRSCLLCAEGTSTFTRGCWIGVAKIPVCKPLHGLSYMLWGETLLLLSGCREGQDKWGVGFLCPLCMRGRDYPVIATERLVPLVKVLLK